MEKTKHDYNYGIWDGRFNIIHNGQEHVLMKVLNEYNNICIGIVNPTPGEPPWEPLNNEKYSKEKNPLTYFQRVYLWNILLRHYCREAVIVPHWPPLNSLVLEKTFLPSPKNSRQWIIPELRNSMYKAKDLKDAGENVRSFDIAPHFANTSASHLIDSFKTNRDDLQSSIPKVILNQTIKFLNGENLNEEFIIIPILQDNINPILICKGIQCSCDKGKTLIFSPVVDVNDGDEWWKLSPPKAGCFSFFKKYEIINKIMNHLRFYDYYVIPILKKGNSCYRVEDFLPPNRSWIFLDGCNTDEIFDEIYSEIGVIEVDCNDVNNNQYMNMALYLNEIFLEQKYNLHSQNQRNGKDESNMSKYDFSHATINGPVIDRVEGDSKYTQKNGLANSSLENILSIILTEAKAQDYELLFSCADERIKDVTVPNRERIVNENVKKHIDTEEKKKSLLEKIKNAAFDISKSVVGGILLQALKGLVFGV